MSVPNSRGHHPDAPNVTAALTECDAAIATLAGDDLIVSYANPAYLRLFPWRIGDSLRETRQQSEFTADIHDAAVTVLATGRPVRFTELPVGERHLQVICSPIRTGHATTGVSVLAVDVSELVFSRERAEARHQRLAVLDDATAAVTAELDPQQELMALAESVVPAIADACAVYLVDHPQSLHAAATGTLAATRLICVIDPALGAAPPAPEVRLRLAPTRPVARAARSNQVVLAHGPQADPSGWNEHWLTTLNPHSFVAIPIGADGSTMAVVSFAATGDRPPYGESELALMRELTARVDVAVGHALRLQHTSEVALTLQRGLLSEPPDIKGLEIRVCYRPAGRGLEVGGDWYDAFTLPTGGLGLSIGDVVGHDLHAASTMGQLRSMVQALACQPGAAPVEVVNSLNRLSQHLRVGDLATVIYGTLLPGQGPAPARFTWANAGHPPPLLLGPDGARLLDCTSSPLLGLTDADYQQASVDVPAESVLLLYTDGLIEDPERPDLDALAGITETASALREVNFGELCDRLIAGAPTRDDIALLAVRVTADTEPGFSN